METEINVNTKFIKIISREGVDAIYTELFGDKNPKELSRKEIIEFGKAIRKAAVEKMSETCATNYEIAEALGVTEGSIRYVKK